MKSLLRRICGTPTTQPQAATPAPAQPSPAPAQPSPAPAQPSPAPAQPSPVRNFTHHDWDSFAGCQSWPCGASPMVRSLGPTALAVADVNGLMVVVQDNYYGEGEGWTEYTNALTLDPGLARHILASLQLPQLHSQYLAELGFTPVAGW